MDFRSVGKVCEPLKVLRLPAKSSLQGTGQLVKLVKLVMLVMLVLLDLLDMLDIMVMVVIMVLLA